MKPLLLICGLALSVPTLAQEFKFTKGTRLRFEGSKAIFVPKSGPETTLFSFVTHGELTSLSPGVVQRKGLSEFRGVPSASVTFVVTPDFVFAVDEEGASYVVVATENLVRQADLEYRPSPLVLKSGNDTFRFLMYQDVFKAESVIRVYRNGPEFEEWKGVLADLKDLGVSTQELDGETVVKLQNRDSTGHVHARSFLLSDYELGLPTAMELYQILANPAAPKPAVLNGQFFRRVDPARTQPQFETGEKDELTEKLKALEKKAKDGAAAYATWSGIPEAQASKIRELFVNELLKGKVDPRLVDFRRLESEGDLDFLFEELALVRKALAEQGYFILVRRGKVFDLMYIRAGGQGSLDQAIADCGGIWSGQ